MPTSRYRGSRVANPPPLCAWCWCWVTLSFVPNTTSSMPRGTSWAIGRPALRAANGTIGRGSRWSVSTKSGDAGQESMMQGVKMPRLTNRMRRLARAYPEAVAAISPAAVEESRARYAAAELPRQEANGAAPKKWSNAELGTPDFFEWLNTIPPDAAERLAEDGDAEEEEEEEEQSGGINIGKAFLLPRAKLSLYDQEIFASSLLEGRDKVLQARSPGQLKIAHDRLRATETAINARTVKVGFEEPAPSAGSATPTEGSRRVQRLPRVRASAGGTRVVYGPSETFAYVYHRMMPAYTVVHRVMTELRNELPDLNPSSMLDFGSGPGTAALAVWDVWGMEGGNVKDEHGQEHREAGSNLSEIRMVEESQSMKDACKVMLEPLTETGRARVGFGTSLLDEARAAGRGGRGGAPGGKKFDLVVAAYSLSHLSTHASRAAATAVMWSLVAPGGVLVLVEDGSAKGSHTVRSARQMVLGRTSSSSSSSEEAGGRRGRGGKGGKGAAPPRTPYVVGPCRHDKECPLQPGEFCRFLQKVPWNAVNVTKSSVKSLPFSYVTMRKGAPVRQASENEQLGSRTSSSSVDLLKAFSEQGRRGGGLSAAMDALGTDGISDATLRRENWARLIRKPLKARGHALLDVCSPDGDIQRKIVGRGKWKGAPGVYVAARKSELGGLWPYLDNHDARDHTASRLQESADDGDGEEGAIETDNGDGEWESERWDEVGDGWERVLDLDEDGVSRMTRRGRAMARQRRGGGRPEDAMLDEE